MAGASMTGATLYTGVTEPRYAAIIETAIEEALWATNVCKKLCRQESLVGQASRAYQLNFWDANTAAAALTEAQDLANTALTMSSVTLTTAEVGAMTTLSDWLLENSIGAARDVASYGTQLGKSIAKKIDTDITALFSALNGGVSAGTGSGDTDVLDAIATASYYLEVNDATNPGDTRAAVLHSENISDLRKQVISQTGVIFNDWNSKKDVIYQDSNGYVGTILNTDIFQTNNVGYALTSSGSTTQGGFRGAMLVPGECLAYVSKREIRQFTQRDESLRATEVGATLAYAVGEIRDKNGICLSLDRGTV